MKVATRTDRGSETPVSRVRGTILGRTSGRTSGKAPGASGGPGRSRSWVRPPGPSSISKAWTLPLVLIAVAAVPALDGVRDDRATEAAGEARKVVVAHVEELLSYDHREIDDELARERTWLTGPFADEYEALVGGEIAPAARRAKVVTEAKVSASGVVSSSSDEVELLLFVNVTTRSEELEAPRTVGSRLEVTATEVGDAWRISALEPV